jgi:Na+/H+ antiporter NhaD/arsenite permease-like protein
VNAEAAPARAPRGAGRVARAALLWAAPLGIALAIASLLAGAPFFGSGPGVPSAGDSRAWLSIWIALGFVGAGSAIGALANLVWLAAKLRERRRASRREWLRFGVTLLIAGGLAAYWFRV